MWGSGTHTNLGEFRSTAPAARPLSDFATEHVGDDLVVFDAETMQYHTLNGVAATIWRACDGIATLETIATSTGLPVEVVETTVSELGEASLLQESANAWLVSINRRRAAKLIAAGMAGAVGVPIVLSITAPSHQAAATDVGTCPAGWPKVCAVGIALGTPCDSGDEGFGTLYCCQEIGTSTRYWWTNDAGTCLGWDCGSACPASGAPEAIQFDVTDASTYNEEIIENDPYLGDEDGNVDVNAIQADSVEQAVESDDAPATDAPAEDVDSAPANDTSGTDASTDSSGGDSEPVDTSSDEEEAPTEEAKG